MVSEDMPEIDESVALHKLNVDQMKKSIKQRIQNHAPEQQAAIDNEVEKLFRADLICKIWSLSG